MQIDKELYEKFPVILRDKLLKNEISFPNSTEFEYDRILVYRAVERKADDFHEITRADFRSYAELKKLPKKLPRGSVGFEKDPHYYGVSSFLDKKMVEQAMHFPNPNKKMATGYVYCEGGPQDTNMEKQHVCWWLYEDANVSDFKLVKEGKDE